MNRPITNTPAIPKVPTGIRVVELQNPRAPFGSIPADRSSTTGTRTQEPPVIAGDAQARFCIRLKQ